jgi:transposase InsO family protein
VDARTRESLAIEVDTSLPGTRVIEVLERLVDLRGLPRTIVADNDPEFVGRALDLWAHDRGCRDRLHQAPNRWTTRSSRASTAGTRRVPA